MDQLTVTAPPNRPVPQERVLRAVASLRDLPAAAPVALKALRCLEDPDSSAEQLRKILLSDQAVAARILSLANSAYFGFRNEVQTVSQAVVLLGQDRIRNLLHRIVADRLLVEMGHGKAAGIRRLSLATATACSMISQLLARGDAEETFLAGLMHNIGDLFFFSQFPEDYERAEQEGMASVFGLSSAQAGGLLLESWTFPPLYAAAVRYCDAPLSPDCPPECRNTVSLVHAGRKVAEGLFHKTPPAETAETIQLEIRQACRLEPAAIREVSEALPERMALEQLQIT